MFRSLFVLLFFVSPLARAVPVTIKVKKVTDTGGSIIINLFNSSNAWNARNDPDPTSVEKITPAVKGTSTKIIDLPPGDYAFFLYNDVNNDGKLEKDWMGKPAEPYAFSNDVQIAFSKPSWDQIKFTVTNTGAKESVTLVDPR
jgi:uncharacterized protein (DUF2141 family)